MHCARCPAEVNESEPSLEAFHPKIYTEIFQWWQQLSHQAEGSQSVVDVKILSVPQRCLKGVSLKEMPYNLAGSHTITPIIEGV